MRVEVWVALAMLLATPSLAGDKPQAHPTAPVVHKTACSLAEAMASKLGYKEKVKHEIAAQSCKILAPTMEPKDHEEFMRCCIKRLESGPATQPKPKSNSVEKTSS